MSPAFIAFVFTAAYYAVTILLVRKVRVRTKDLCICSIIIAMTLVLESVWIPLPTGAALPCASMAPLMLLALISDYRLACLSGAVCGILAMILIPTWQPVHWGQIFVEHLVCFSCLGYAGIFGSDSHLKKLCGIVLASVLCICGHILSGVLFFSQNAWDGWGAWGYSISYNLSENVPLSILSGIIVLYLPLKSLKRVAERK